MITQLELGKLNIDVTQKDIKNIHLSVYPPNGKVRVSAPLTMPIDIIRVFLISKLGWIKKQQQKLIGQDREAPREYLNRESHYFNGERYLLKVLEHNKPPKITLNHKTISLFIRPETSEEKRKKIFDEWYRCQLKSKVPALIEKYEKIMGVKVLNFGVRKMKTKWGSCNPVNKKIWLNLELAKKPPECLEYIVVHELTHLLEPTHNENFVSLIGKFMPNWKVYKDELNRLPVRHENWSY
ncbi:MAG: M48 family metallopeptidase [Rickettsiales bacterium]|jgi:predicted metal-dependent hydrolase|nr:M48 family metallopeptidase [Rickettsiales bacterium]